MMFNCFNYECEGQMSLSDYDKKEKKINKPIRLIELFAGVGSQAMALRDLGADFETYRVVEFDKYAIKSYNAIHGTNFPTMDITKIHGSYLGITERYKYEYIMTYSFPCQDLSLAGKCKGMEKGSGTRSGLLWEVERLLNETEELPQILLMENVSQVHGKKNIDDFNKWIDFLENKGYSNYWQDLNAKEYANIPQNRNRCFMISILGKFSYKFPQKKELKLRLKDMLESEVDEKYYLSEKMLNYCLSDGTGKFPRRERFLQNINRKNQDIANSVTTNAGNRPVDNFVKCEPVRIGGLFDDEKTKHQASSIWDKESINPTIDTMQGGYRQPCITVKEATKQGYAIAKVGDSININQPNSTTRRGRVGHGVAQTLTTQQEQVVLEPNVLTPKRTEYGKQIRKDYESGKIKESRHNMNEMTPRKDGISNTLTTVQKDNILIEPRAIKVGQVSSENSQAGTVYSTNGISQTLCAGTHGYAMGNIQENLRIRKLTPKECWRLMGFTDEDFEKAEKVNSNTQLYKQAGNSIVKQVLMEIFKQLL